MLDRRDLWMLMRWNQSIHCCVGLEGWLRIVTLCVQIQCVRHRQLHWRKFSQKWTAVDLEKISLGHWSALFISAIACFDVAGELALCQRFFIVVCKHLFFLFTIETPSSHFPLIPHPSHSKKMPFCKVTGPFCIGLGPPFWMVRFARARGLWRSMKIWGWWTGPTSRVTDITAGCSW